MTADALHERLARGRNASAWLPSVSPSPSPQEGEGRGGARQPPRCCDSRVSVVVELLHDGGLGDQIFVEQIELVLAGGNRSSAPSSTWMRQVPQLADRQENGMGASCASHRSTRATPWGASISTALPALDSVISFAVEPMSSLFTTT
jgi:hypothetical protein